MNKIILNVHCVIGLQNCLLRLSGDSVPCTGTSQTSSDDVNQFVGNKGEDAVDIKVEEDPWPATSMEIKTDPTVSCMSVCIMVYVR
jgi:hypothetical protein